MSDPGASAGPPRFDRAKRKRMMPQGKVFNAVKRFVARIFKPFFAQKLDPPQNESPAQDPPMHVQTSWYQCGEPPAYAEIEHFYQQPPRYRYAFQAPFNQPEQVQSQQESHHHHHYPPPNTFRPDSLDYCPTYEEPGPPYGYIIPESGRRTPHWYQPRTRLLPLVNHSHSHW